MKNINRPKDLFFFLSVRNKSRKCFFPLLFFSLADFVVVVVVVVVQNEQLQSPYMHFSVRTNFIITTSKPLPPESCVFMTQRIVKKSDLHLLSDSSGGFIYHHPCE